MSILKSILFLTITITNGVVIADTCDGVTINEVYYKKEILLEGLARPYLLVFDNKSNVLYYSVNRNPDSEDFHSAYLNLNNKESFVIEDVPNGFAQTVDERNHDVYIGGDDGIFLFNYNTKTSSFFSAKSVNIWRLYFNDILYYINFPNQFLYTLINGEIKRFKYLEDTKVDHFLIDREDDMFYVNETGFYMQKKGTKDALKLDNISDVRALTMDAFGRVFLCTSEGIFSVDKSKGNVEKIVALDDGFGLAFDSNNHIIYSEATDIVRLVPSDVKCEKEKALPETEETTSSR